MIAIHKFILVHYCHTHKQVLLFFSFSPHAPTYLHPRFVIRRGRRQQAKHKHLHIHTHIYQKENAALPPSSPPTPAAAGGGGDVGDDCRGFYELASRRRSNRRRVSLIIYINIYSSCVNNPCSAVIDSLPPCPLNSPLLSRCVYTLI